MFNMTLEVTAMIVEIIRYLTFIAPFYEWSSTALRLEPLRGGSLLLPLLRLRLILVDPNLVYIFLSAEIYLPQFGVYL